MSVSNPSPSDAVDPSGVDAPAGEVAGRSGWLTREVVVSGPLPEVWLAGQGSDTDGSVVEVSRAVAEVLWPHYLVELSDELPVRRAAVGDATVVERRELWTSLWARQDRAIAAAREGAVHDGLEALDDPGSPMGDLVRWWLALRFVTDTFTRHLIADHHRDEGLSGLDDPERRALGWANEAVFVAAYPSQSLQIFGWGFAVATADIAVAEGWQVPVGIG